MDEEISGLARALAREGYRECARCGAPISQPAGLLSSRPQGEDSEDLCRRCYGETAMGEQSVLVQEED